MRNPILCVPESIKLRLERKTFPALILCVERPVGFKYTLIADEIFAVP